MQCTRVKRGGRSVAAAALCLTFAAVHLLPSFVPPCTSDSPTSSKLAGIPAEAFIVESRCTPQGHSPASALPTLLVPHMTPAMCLGSRRRKSIGPLVERNSLVARADSLHKATVIDENTDYVAVDQPL